MRATVIVAAFMAAVPAMAQFDVACMGACIDLIDRCCGHDNGACDTLASCGASYRTDGCSNQSSACLSYCSNFGVELCLNEP